MHEAVIARKYGAVLIYLVYELSARGENTHPHGLFVEIN